jgi:hypothetical protein
MPHSLVIQAGPLVTRRVLVADAILTSKISYICPFAGKGCYSLDHHLQIDRIPDLSACRYINTANYPGFLPEWNSINEMETNNSQRPAHS